MSIFGQIAEARITEAMQRGEFDDLPGAGKPLELEDLSHIPAHLRLGYKVLRNADALPPEVELRREIYSLDRLIEATSDTEDLDELRRRRRESEVRYSLLLERRSGGGALSRRGRARSARPRPLRGRS